jgi:DNA-binding response OmpR family regulator
VAGKLLKLKALFMPTFRNYNKIIVVVDDEENDRSTACKTLLCIGCTILEADSYRRAVTVFEASRGRVELLVADLSLPDGDACELALQLRDRQPALRVLFVSGQVGAELCRFYGLDQRGIHFLRKPFTANQLSESVWRVLNAAVPFPRLQPDGLKAQQGA